MYPHTDSKEPQSSHAGNSPGILLVDMPFSSFVQPNIGLSLIKASLLRAGYSCRIRYANLEFINQIGSDAYRTIGEFLPQEHLIGDLVFSHLTSENQDDYFALKGAVGDKDFNRGGVLPDWLWRCMPELKAKATNFVSQLADDIAAADYDIVGFTLMFQRTPSLALAKAIKARAPNITTVVGGASCEGMMGLAMHRSYNFIDFVCNGEGEDLIVDLVNRLRNKNQSFGGIKGLVWRKSNVTVSEGERSARIGNMDSVPTPDYSDWLQQRREALGCADLSDVTLPIETSRGCWFGEKSHCIFCGLNGDSMAFRAKSAERVIKEFEELALYGISTITSTDLIMPNQYFKTLLPWLAHSENKFNIFYEIKANLNRAQLELLRAAGVTHIQPGIESLSTPMLKLMKKGVTAFQNIRLLKWSLEIGINVYWNLLYGFPGEQPSEYGIMAELIPWISHFRPPVDGCCRLRLDRFSPLFINQQAYNIKTVQPAFAYNIVYDLPPAELHELAYHFEFEEHGGPKSIDYIEPVRAAVQSWDAGVGTISFFAIHRDDQLLLFDRRMGAATPYASISGLERKIFDACESGATLSEIAHEFNLDENRVQEALSLFLERHWVIYIDGRYLSLPILMDKLIGDDVPIPLIGSVGHVIYKKRILSMWEPSVVKKYRPDDAEAVGELNNIFSVPSDRL